MSEHPQWLLNEDQIALADRKGYSYEENADRFLLKRESDKGRIWPHIDGFVSCFVREGQYVKHRKYQSLERALDRRFGDAAHE